MAAQSSSSKTAWYALRRTLPVWSFEENLKELVDYLPQYKVDELILKVDTEEFTHGQPPLEWIKRYQPLLFRAKEALNKIGVVYSINPWITVGHCDRGRDARRQLPGLQTCIGHNGVECICCACPLCETWRKNVDQVWTLLSETKPHIMWIEDDIRTFNHAPVDFSCFCPIHLERFGKIIGKKVTREEVVSAMLQAGKPHPWRKMYLDMLADIMVETVGFLAKVVHKVSPESSLGLMSSGPRQHALEGRKWSEFAKSMADGRPLYSRPPMGNYSEGSLRGFYYSQDSIKITRHCMPKDTIEQTEVENVPFTRYSKSVAFTFIEMAISFAYGSHGVTMNYFDHCGTPMQDEPWYGTLMAEKKPFLTALTSRAQIPGSFRGVQLLHRDDAGFVKELSGNNVYSDMGEDGHEAMEALEIAGLPTTFDDSPVMMLAGQTIRAFSDEQIRAMLSKGKGVFIDAVAAGALVERGFGELIGLKSIQKPVIVDDFNDHKGLAAEEFFNPKFGGKDKKFLTLTVPHLGGRPLLAQAQLADKTELITAAVDPDAVRKYPITYAFENSLGGRVIVHLFDIRCAWGSYHHPHRTQLLQNAFRWLSHDRLPVALNMGAGGVYPLAFRKDTPDFTLLGFFDLTIDPWKGISWECTDNRKVDRVELLSQDGQWRTSDKLKVKQDAGKFTVEYDGSVPNDQPLFVTVFWK